VIYRITPRRNDEVNDTWMADSGRLLYQQVRAPGRLAGIKIGDQPATLEAAIAAAGSLLRAGSVAVVGSGRSSVEEQYLTRKLAEGTAAPAYVVGRSGAGDKLLISADRNPNVRGAVATGLIRALPTAKLEELAIAIDAGQIKTVVSVGEDLIAGGLTAAQLAKVAVIYLGTQADWTSAAARVLLPGLTVFEKNGTFINQQFRLQKFAAAVPGPAGTTDELVTLSQLVAAAGGTLLAGEPAGLWTALAAEVPALAAITFRGIPDTGLLLDGTPWAGLAFAEGPGLHFRPAARA
jgi:NADH-quinone oxidoreductase subunit G